MLEAGRREGFEYVTAAVTKVVDNLSVDPTYATAHGSSFDQYSQHDAMRLGDFVKQLRDKKLWPDRLGIDLPLKLSIDEVCEALRTIYDTSTLEASGDSCRACCGLLLEDLMASLAANIRGFTRAREFCFACANAGGMEDYCEAHQPVLPGF